MNKNELFSSLEQRYGLPEGYLARTELLESGGGKKTFNPDSGAAGNFQFLPKYQKAYGITDPYDLQQSAEAAAKLAAQNRNILQQKGIENPSAADLYAAHQQGATGYANLLKAGDRPAASVVGKDAVLQNGGKADMSASEFANKISSKFEASNPAPRTATGTLSDEALTQGPPAPVEGKPELSTEEVLSAMEPRQSSGSGLKELGLLHNYFKSLDTSATGVKPLAVPDLFHQQRYAYGGIANLR